MGGLDSFESLGPLCCRTWFLAALGPVCVLMFAFTNLTHSTRNGWPARASADYRLSLIYFIRQPYMDGMVDDTYQHTVSAEPGVQSITAHILDPLR